ncbi:hypothetical protein HDV06_005150 [Boothiomyces sp. JEL0866]|nr:hypothetical protein HDV06_005150 [Boothiomyces sp. JEL0866]
MLADSDIKTNTPKTGNLEKIQQEAPPAPSTNKRDELQKNARDARKTQFGIDCADLVHFSHWEPGGEYVKSLVIKNVVMKTQKIKYKLPGTRYFSMEFPETQTLSAGMKWTVNVTFRPVAKECYNDKIEFTTSFGTFYIYIKATLPEHVMEFPEIIDFGYCPIRETAKFNFMMHNTGELASDYEWTIDPPFSITSTSGHILPGTSVSVLLEFKPTQAMVMTAPATCTFGVKKQWEKSKVVKTAKVCGIAKFSHLIIQGNSKLFDFGDVYVGTTLEQTMILENPSAVHANFKIKKAHKDNDACFEFSTMTGTVESQSTLEIKFLIEKSSTFKIDKQSGVIGPNSVIPLQVKFCPKEPINYYRRVYCLIENQDAIYLDLIGTCYNDKRRPATFKPYHIENYKLRIQNGLWEYGPEQLEEMIKSEVVECKDGVLSYKDKDLALTKSKFVPKDRPYQALVSSEFFYGNSGDFLPCNLLDTYIDFGSCSRFRVAEPQTIRIQNRTKGKMSCIWMDEDDNKDECLFMVTPKTADIPSKSIAEFKVQFRPKVDSEFYGKQLECFVYYKSMRNFRLVNEDTFTPPWCLTPVVAGNTFPPGEDTFIPKVHFGKTKIIFPPCYVDRSEYQIIRITNTGDTTVKFSFLDIGFDSSLGLGGDTEAATKGGAVFSAKPRVGTLKKHESRLIVLRFSPSEQKLYEESFTCYFNNSLHNSYSLQLRGYGSFPKISFDNDNSINFKPTCVGSVSTRNFNIKNASKTQVHFQWQIPTQYTSVVAINPISGTLKSDEILQLQCTFAPATTTNYVLKLPCYYFHEDDAKDRERVTFAVFGKGIYGKLTSSPEKVDFGNVLINTMVEREVVIFNSTECDVQFSLKIGYVETEEGNGKPIRILPNNLQESEFEILQPSKIIAARSNQTVKIKACLKSEQAYNISVYYKIDKQEIAESKPISIASNTIIPKEEHYLCDIVAVGVHPIIAVRDIRSKGFSKTILWQLFSLERFNELLAEPNQDPYAYAEQLIDDNSFPTEAPPINLSSLEADVNFDFGATTAGTPPIAIKMTLKNCGVVPVDWDFNFPNDYDVEVENWADPGDCTEDQITRNFILDNSIFCVSPKSGSLKPGEMEHILFTYSHEFAGPHRLPVVFKLRNGSSRAGKEILINFIGYSVPETQKFLHLQSINHRFENIDIGTSSPPVQYYRLMNRGSSDLEYTIDPSAIQRLNEENNQFEILKCNKTGGIIPAGEMDYLQFVFNPLEVKDYELDLPITVDNGKTRMISFRGSGIQQNLPNKDGPLLNPKDIKELIPIMSSLPPLLSPLAVISLERIDFCHVPIKSVLRQVLVVTNVTEDTDISITWVIPSVWPKDCKFELTAAVQIRPTTCKLAPGESRVCKLIIEPDDEPRLYHFDIICSVTNETAMAQYRREYPTEEEKILKNGELIDSHSSKSVTQLASISSKSSNGQDLKQIKYKKLPAINDKNSQRTNSAKSRKSSEISDPPENADPLPPAPINLFVGIRAQSHLVEEFSATYYGTDKFYRLKRTGYPTSAETDVQEFKDMKDLFLDVMSGLLNQVFESQKVKHLPEQISNEPVKYFRKEDLTNNSTGVNSYSDQDIISCFDFQNSVEEVLEGTIYNMMQELNQGEFDCTVYPMLVSKPV